MLRTNPPVPVGASVPLVPARVLTAPVSLTELARRPPIDWEEEREMRRAYIITTGCGEQLGARDMIDTQIQWSEFVEETKKLCCDNFWKIFLQLHTCSTTAIDRALNSVKKVFVHDKQEKQQFPMSKRVLLERVPKTFWPKVSHTYELDVSRFALASGTSSLTFKFIDPVWAWIVAARRQHPEELHWKPIAQRHGDEKYGGGIQYGKLFKQACASVPAGAYPMLLGLHWDGTGAHGLSSSPICVCVGNTNSCDRSVQFCVGYMPHVSDEKSPEFRKTQNCTRLKVYIRQKCAAAILRVLEEAATRGVTCRLLNADGTEVRRWLFPRFSSTNFDQPEAQLFFGLQNKTCCSKCRRRKGYSAFRGGCVHDVEEIKRLYTLAPQYREAREQLKRWGFNWQRKCCILTCCNNLLVNIPGVSTELFPCLDYRDRMHAGVIFIHRALFEILDKVVKRAPHRRLLDERLAFVCRRGFRVVNTTFRPQKTIFSDVGMTAGDKSCVVFLLSHVLGHIEDDRIWPPGMYLPLVTAVAHAQMILLALRGRRLYTKDELELIFDRGYIMLFGSLEQVQQIHYNALVRAAAQSSEPAPKRFKREER